MKLCFATQNRNKLKEVQAMLPEGIVLETPEDLGCLEELPETHLTLEGNSKQKAEFLFQNFNADCFADDTGLEVEALDGEPGVFSARYAGPQKMAADNIRLLLHKLKGQSQRRAHFRTVITLVLQGQVHVFEGLLEGTIIDEPRGMNGFGYDPVFIPEGYEQTLAEMSLEQKNSISHRGRAFAKLKTFLAQRLNTL